MRGTTLLALALCLVGCRQQHPTKQQQGVFTEQVAPELRRVLTNASIAVAPFELVNTHPVIGGTLWDARMDNYSFTLESCGGTVRLLSLVASPEAQEAISRLRAPSDIVEHKDFYLMTSTTNQQIEQVAKALGYQYGAIVPSREVGIRLEWTNIPNKAPLAFTRFPLDVGHVGIYSASTNFDSIDLVVLVHRGAVKAILQRPL
jgi:hypothetical protein